MNSGTSQGRSGHVVLVSAVALLAVVTIAGAAYFWHARSPLSSEDDSLKTTETLSDSDAVVDIEADLNATNLEQVEYNLDEGNFNAS